MRNFKIVILRDVIFLKTCNKYCGESLVWFVTIFAQQITALFKKHSYKLQRCWQVFAGMILLSHG